MYTLTALILDVIKEHTTIAEEKIIKFIYRAFFDKDDKVIECGSVEILYSDYVNLINKTLDLIELFIKYKSPKVRSQALLDSDPLPSFSNDPYTNDPSLNQEILSLGNDIYDIILSEDVKVLIQKTTPEYIILRSSDYVIPWELMHDGEKFLWETMAFGRVPSLTVKEKIITPSLMLQIEEPNFVLIANPTSDLPHSEKEITQLYNFLKSSFDPKKILVVKGKRASKQMFLYDILRNPNYTIIHFSGHGDIENNKGYFLFADGKVFSFHARFLKGHPLIFANACKSAGASYRNMRRYDMSQFVSNMALEFTKNGAFGFIGNIWPVNDYNAATFAITFYKNFLRGDPIGKAIINAKKELKKQETIPDWLGFILYGDPRRRLSIISGGLIASDKSSMAKELMNMYGSKSLFLLENSFVIDIYNLNGDTKLILKNELYNPTDKPKYTHQVAIYSDYPMTKETEKNFSVHATCNGKKMNIELTMFTPSYQKIMFYFPKPLQKGETIAYTATINVPHMYNTHQPSEYWAWPIDYPVYILSKTIKAPKGLKITSCEIINEKTGEILSAEKCKIEVDRDGRYVVSWKKIKPIHGITYRIQWGWLHIDKDN